MEEQKIIEQKAVNQSSPFIDDNDTFDIATLWHTLEHLPNPLENLEEIRRILKCGGLLFIEVPNINFLENYFFRLFGIANYLFFKEHLVHFTPKTLKGMVIKAGFVVKELTISDISMTEKGYNALIELLFIYCSKLIYYLTGLNLTHDIRLVAIKR